MGRSDVVFCDLDRQIVLIDCAELLLGGAAERLGSPRLEVGYLSVLVLQLPGLHLLD